MRGTTSDGTSIVATAGTPVADESDHTILLAEADEEVRQPGMSAAPPRSEAR